VLNLNQKRPIQSPSVCSDSVESPDEDMDSHIDMTNKLDGVCPKARKRDRIWQVLGLPALEWPWDSTQMALD
jgi:hypothetical protein